MDLGMAIGKTNVTCVVVKTPRHFSEFADPVCFGGVDIKLGIIDPIRVLVDEHPAHGRPWHVKIDRLGHGIRERPAKRPPFSRPNVSIHGNTAAPILPTRRALLSTEVSVGGTPKHLRALTEVRPQQRKSLSD